MSRGVGLVGCGLMGTSIAMSAVRGGDRVRGWDPDAAVLRRSVERAAFVAADSPTEAIGGAEIVFVCAPTEALPAMVVDCLRDAPGAIVTDVGSVKTSVVERVRAAAPAGDLPRFVGGHPMGGSERTGPDAASASIIDGAVWVLTPTAETDPANVGQLERWIRGAGAKPMTMDPAAHDRVVAVVSHLPQVLSTGLMGLAAREERGFPDTLLLAAGGFRDLTRLAASNPQLWAGILRANRDELSRTIDRFIQDLEAIQRLLDDDDPAGLEAVLAEATAARLTLAARPKVRAGVAILQVPVPDRPGMLAALTATLSERDVNIEDLQMVHSPEGGRGTVHLTVAGSDVEPTIQAVTAAGFEAFRIA